MKVYKHALHVRLLKQRQIDGVSFCMCLKSIDAALLVVGISGLAYSL